MTDIIQIDTRSATAKYKQIVHSILEAIHDEKLNVGDRIPSLNQLVGEFHVSQDTVLTAYNELKHRGIISSSVGKGYFIARTDIRKAHNIFVLFDKMTPYKELLYESMKEAAGQNANLDIYFHHGNQKAFNTLVRNAIGQFTAYIIVPIISTATQNLFREIPKKRLFILDQGITRYGKQYRSVCQNFEKDIRNALNEGLPEMKKYRKFYFIHKDHRQQFRQLENGFVKFCKKHNLDYTLLPDLTNQIFMPKDLYIVIDDKDLVRLVKQCKKKGYKAGKDVGIISYNDSPFKEIIEDGITTISTDFEKMGHSVMEMVLDNKTRHLENPSRLIKRKSL